MNKMSSISYCKLFSIFILSSFIVMYLFVSILVISTTYISCKITKVLNRECYEIDGINYFKQFVEINGNNKAFINCGKVINCETSSCNFKYDYDLSYICSLEKDNLYLLPNDPSNLIISTVAILLSCGFLVIILICISATELHEVKLFCKGEQFTKANNESSVLVNSLNEL